MPISVIINRQPQKIATVIARKPQKIATVTQVLRGARGATDITAIAPLQLTSEDKLQLQPFEFIQRDNLATWIINHNLDRRFLLVKVFDDFGEELSGEVRAIDNNNLKIIFNQPVTGTAYLL